MNCLSQSFCKSKSNQFFGESEYLERKTFREDRLQLIKQRQSAVLKVPFDSFHKEELTSSDRVNFSLNALNKARWEYTSASRREGRVPEGRSGLSNNKQVRQKRGDSPLSLLSCRFSGKQFYVDPDKIRLDKLKKASFNYVKALNSLSWADDASGLSKGSYAHQFFTLTYNSMEDWEAGDISKFSDRLRRYIERKIKTPVHDPWLYLGLFWVREFHKSGKVHYHFLLSSPREWGFLDMKKSLFKFDVGSRRSKGVGLWTKGSTRYGTKTGEEVRNAAYIAKYASKGSSDAKSTQYRGQRCFGCSFPKKSYNSIVKYPLSVYRYMQMPNWLRKKISHSFRDVEKPWYLSGEESPEFFKSHLSIVRVSGGYVVNSIFYESPYSFNVVEGRSSIPPGGSSPGGDRSYDFPQDLNEYWERIQLEIFNEALISD